MTYTILVDANVVRVEEVMKSGFGTRVPDRPTACRFDLALDNVYL